MTPTTPIHRIDREDGTTFERGESFYNKCKALTDVVSAIAYSKSSEEVVASSWYNHVFDVPLKMASSVVPGIKFNRNVVDKSYTLSKERRDMNCWMNDRLVVAGKVKRYAVVADDISIPEQELVDKAPKRINRKELYGPLQYIIGFAAASSTGRFYRLDLTTNELEPITEIYNLDDRKHRIKLITIGLNLIRWIRTITAYLPSYDLEREDRPSTFGATQSDMTILKRVQGGFTKSFSLPVDKQSTWLEVYRLLQTGRIVNTAQYTININGTTIDFNRILDSTIDVRVELSVIPIGVERIPDTSDKLKSAIESVLEFLVSFHREGFVHRDLRWPNILQHQERYFVIDFETADVNERSIFWQGQPRFYVREVYEKERPYTFKDDLFQVGTLIGRALLVRDPARWSPEVAATWDSYADQLRALELQSATDALARLHSLSL